MKELLIVITSPFGAAYWMVTDAVYSLWERMERIDHVKFKP